ncbi:EpsD family peptidyl-prolyl cis-trans isomerase [uncultured Methylibium sp.]|uniref:EpsD family peptidyl-prolyl cis-trans isomerase n=1 Tax=uncultured Methylibium sp. TaxID=381093 RepID=UPI0025E1710E|nr:EpsD family peptidyl-prolyl cis-trans isomerase [uncultured Methylibium sp.]
MLAGLLAACGGGKDKPPSQVAAKVNKEEISVHQVNHLLQQQRVRADQADRAGRQALERLIDQELALQRAAELRVDREPQVLAQLEAARREIIARAYAERVAEAAGKPDADEVRRYYVDKPALFSERRIYSLQEISIEARPEQVEALRGRLAGGLSVGALVEHLKGNDLRFTVSEAVRAAEQLPLGSVDAFAKMRDGESVLTATPTGAQVLLLVASRSEPVDEARARPAIEQFLVNEGRRKRVEDDIRALRAAAKIEYVGRFNEPAATERNAGQAPSAAVPVVVPASGALDVSVINSGMGLKK